MWCLIQKGKETEGVKVFVGLKGVQKTLKKIKKINELETATHTYNELYVVPPKHPQSTCASVILAFLMLPAGARGPHAST